MAAQLHYVIMLLLLTTTLFTQAHELSGQTYLLSDQDKTDLMSTKANVYRRAAECLYLAQTEHAEWEKVKFKSRPKELQNACRMIHPLKVKHLHPLGLEAAYRSTIAILDRTIAAAFTRAPGTPASFQDELETSIEQQVWLDQQKKQESRLETVTQLYFKNNCHEAINLANLLNHYPQTHQCM